MEIKYIEEISSTHNVLSNLIRDDEISKPFLLYAISQTDGIGSRGNSWESEYGNLFLSFSLSSNSLPHDLPVHSASIYFSWIVVEILRSYGSKVCLKWPNDFYIKDKKLGGMITSKIKDFFVVSFGINFKTAKNEYSKLDVDVDICEFVAKLSSKLNNLPSWKHIFSNYELEFSFSQKFFAHIDGKKISLKDAKLLNDGSIEIDSKKVYSLR